VFKKVLVANRGAVASRVLRALASAGVPSVAVYSDADANAPYLAMAGETFHLGGAAPLDSYLNQDALLDVLARSGADAVHPGYGFLSENASFASEVEARGARFIGPSPRWIDVMGHKTRARALAARSGLAVGAGSDVIHDVAAARRCAAAIGYPVLVKPAAGGGGIGMIAVHAPEALAEAVERAAAIGHRGFANGDVYLERLVERPRHIEFQVLGDREGHVRNLFERDCSVQRRHQKIVEEAPAPGLLRASAIAQAEHVAQTLDRLGYDNIGTVEMLMDARGQFTFLEMNTRLQVEHGVTEAVTGVDLVVAQIRAAAGESLASILPSAVTLEGHAIEARVYAEDPGRFLPSPGPLNVFRPPLHTGVRVETGYAEGQVVTPHYDPLLAKLIVHAPTRDRAIESMCDALDAFAIEGVRHNIPALRRIVASHEFRAGSVHTGLVAEVLARNP
jgi:acetyl-CoA carboxylase biotin carboxylase subunit